MSAPRLHAVEAISRAPWLTALTFLPQESTWQGGGAFTPLGALWLNSGDAGLEPPLDGLKAALQVKPDWEWPGLWQGVLHFARHGALFEAEIGRDGLGPARCLHDFCAMCFEPRTAPYIGAEEETP